MSSLFAAGGHGSEFESKDRQLTEFIDHLGPLPTPWGLKVISAIDSRCLLHFRHK